MPSTPLTANDFSDAATMLSCDVAAVRAVCAVESNGSGFLPDGRPKILFESRIFSRLTLHKFDLTHPKLSTAKWSPKLYLGGAAEYARYDAACALDAGAAQRATSWGALQILGLNYHFCGFASVGQFIAAMRASERAHLVAFTHYLLAVGLADELRNHQWHLFAAGYNGPLYKKNRYDEKLATAYAKFARS